MNEVIELKQDNLVNYFNHENLIVFFSKEGCKACVSVKKWLYLLPEKYQVVVVDGIRHMASIRYFPGGIKFYPTIAHYNNGQFMGELTTKQLLTKTIE